MMTILILIGLGMFAVGYALVDRQLRRMRRKS